MRRRPTTPAFKATQVYDWANEPQDERPTDFGRSTGYSVLSGHGDFESSYSVRRRTQRRAGFLRLVLWGLMALGLSTTVLVLVVNNVLRG
jgi:hypothetical protein